MSKSSQSKILLRTLKFLAQNGQVQFEDFRAGDASFVKLSTNASAKMLCPGDVLDRLDKSGLVKIFGEKIELQETGRRKLLRALNKAHAPDPNPFGSQHRSIEKQEVELNGERQTVDMNIHESPLARLRFRKTRQGEPWLDDIAYQAGERLRKDFTFGQLNQKVTSSWDPTQGSSTLNGHAGGKSELTDFAIDARSRLDAALKSVGPDLAGVLTDVCCYLKGLERVEKERRWPPRSAKLMLRTGLELLARHYGMQAGKRAGT